MKKKAVCMLLGVLLTGTLLTGCGKNKATEAASESAQTEKEGTGEKTADSAEDDQKKTDETADTKTDKKAEKGTDAEETGEDASETEENREKIVKLIFKHTTTIGIRETLCHRYILDRKEDIISTDNGNVRVKTSFGYGTVRHKYEYNDLKFIAKKTGLSIQELIEKLDS